MKRGRIVLLLVTIFFSRAVAEDGWQPIGNLLHEGPLEHFFEPIFPGDPCDGLEGWKALNGIQNAEASIEQG